MNQGHSNLAAVARAYQTVCMHAEEAVAVAVGRGGGRLNVRVCVA